MECPFCNLDTKRIFLENDQAVAIRDGYPISPGHILIIPKRHVASFFELNEQEEDGVWALLKQARVETLQSQRPDGFNIGINDGIAAGQTVMHLHIHLIPRYSGDQPDPRGGVRWIFPDKADYWSKK
jgi:diadenosine tetraphosphate (Ap4A) HIT family hydrolase